MTKRAARLRRFKSFAELCMYAEMMARFSGRVIPKHLRNQPGRCMAVCLEAAKLKWSPLALAQMTYMSRGKLLLGKPDKSPKPRPAKQATRKQSRSSTERSKCMRKTWTDSEVRTMKSMARRKVPAKKIAKTLKRTEGATRQKAFSIGLSLESRPAG